MEGLLFAPEMVRAIADGKKTVTRRLTGFQIINQNPDYWDFVYSITGAGAGRRDVFMFEHGLIHRRIYPRYQVGDVAYVKEPWAVEKIYDKYPPRNLPSNIEVWFNDELGGNFLGRWRSPLFMPAWAARYHIKITDIRVERLEEITVEDCQAEGVVYMPLPKVGWMEFGYTKPYNYTIEHFAYYWSLINKDYPWGSNPWIWRIQFEKVKHE